MPKAFRAFARAAVLAILLASCSGGGGGSGGGAVATQKTGVDMYGESTLTGYMLQPGESAPERLQAALPSLAVANYAVNGTTTRQMLDGKDGKNPPFAQAMAKSTAEVVVLDRGGNEAYFGTAPETFRAELREAVSIAQ